ACCWRAIMSMAARAAGAAWRAVPLLGGACIHIPWPRPCGPVMGKGGGCSTGDSCGGTAGGESGHRGCSSTCLRRCTPGDRSGDCSCPASLRRL
ncbi:MAG: hypothetical protein J3K34DRAFT_445577, partial [Monoraphidium minutum]